MYLRYLCKNYFKHFGCHYFSTAINVKNHYISLGIKPNATHSDIKSAYYKLSMLYHPDKNKGSEEASKKFRDITAAYEVLGNFKLRKLYDKGILHTDSSTYAAEEDYQSVEHPEDKFYRSRTVRHTAPTMTGRTPIYDFDEWSKAHYGATFQRANRARMRYRAKVAKMEQDEIDIKNETVILSIMTIFFVCVLVSFIQRKGYYDKDETKKD